MDKKRILVTGGTGFIGRALAHELVAAGYKVVALTRDPAKSAAVFGSDAGTAEWDGRTAGSWARLADGALAIVNLAGDNLAEGRWTRAKKARILSSRVESGSAVVAAVKAAKQKPGVVVQASAVGAYGPRGDEELDELSPRGSGFLAGVVEQWEDSTLEVEALGVRRVVIRSGLVLGRGAGVFPRLLAPFRFFAGGPLGSGRQWFPWIHIRDEVRAIRFLVENEELSGIFNLAAPNPLREIDFCRALGRALGKPCWLQVPALVLELLFGEKARETLLAGQRVLPRRLTRASFVFNYPDPAMALHNLLEE